MSISEHAEAHRLLYLQHNRLQDKLAWKMLSGKTNEAESLRIILAHQGIQKFLSDPCRKAVWIENISKSNIGKKQSFETRLKRSQSLKLAYMNPQVRENHKLSFTNEQRVASRQRLLTGGSDRLAAARKQSLIWKESVTNADYRDRASKLSPRRKAVIVNDVWYHSIRSASRTSGFLYSQLLCGLERKDTQFIRYA